MRGGVVGGEHLRRHLERYEYFENGRIKPIAATPFNLSRAIYNWTKSEPDPILRRWRLEEVKEDAAAKSHLYTAQCAEDLIRAFDALENNV
jgi:hypothetical protein